jgi:hypothetical protein
MSDDWFEWRKLLVAAAAAAEAEKGQRRLLFLACMSKLDLEFKVLVGNSMFSPSKML